MHDGSYPRNLGGGGGTALDGGPADFRDLAELGESPSPRDFFDLRF